MCKKCGCSKETKEIIETPIPDTCDCGCDDECIDTGCDCNEDTLNVLSYDIMKDGSIEPRFM